MQNTYLHKTSCPKLSWHHVVIQHVSKFLKFLGNSFPKWLDSATAMWCTKTLQTTWDKNWKESSSQIIVKTYHEAKFPIVIMYHYTYEYLSITSKSHSLYGSLMIFTREDQVHTRSTFWACRTCTMRGASLPTRGHIGQDEFHAPPQKNGISQGLLRYSYQPSKGHLFKVPYVSFQV